jgi:hypothetical protein
MKIPALLLSKRNEFSPLLSEAAPTEMTTRTIKFPALHLPAKKDDFSPLRSGDVVVTCKKEQCRRRRLDLLSWRTKKQDKLLNPLQRSSDTLDDFQKGHWALFSDESKSIHPSPSPLVRSTGGMYLRQDNEIMSDDVLHEIVSYLLEDNPTNEGGSLADTNFPKIDEEVEADSISLVSYWKEEGPLVLFTDDKDDDDGAAAGGSVSNQWREASAIVAAIGLPSDVDSDDDDNDDNESYHTFCFSAGSSVGDDYSLEGQGSVCSEDSHSDKRSFIRNISPLFPYE